MITAVDGEAVTDMDDVIAIVNDGKPGDELELDIDRDGDQAGDRRSRLGERPASTGNGTLPRASNQPNATLDIATGRPPRAPSVAVSAPCRSSLGMTASQVLRHDQSRGRRARRSGSAPGRSG